VWLNPGPFEARSLRLNFEFDVEYYNAELGSQLDTLIKNKRAAAHRVTLEEVDGRSRDFNFCGEAIRSTNFKITELPDGLADLISQSREVPSQLAVATQRPSGGLTATSKLRRGAFQHIQFGGPGVFHHPIWLTQSVRRKELYVADVPSVDQRYYRSFF
jgi:hypothetical protein